VIVDDLDVVRGTLQPAEAESVLVIDPDAVLAVPVAPQSLEPIAGRDGEQGECADCIELGELPLGDTPGRRRADPARGPGVLPVEHVLRARGREGLDHPPCRTVIVITVQAEGTDPLAQGGIQM
jgi:hypothetical protein